MPDSVTVSVPARLHLGFFDLDATLGRRFGSIGLGLDRPLTTIRISRAARDLVTGPEQQRATAYLAKLRHVLGIGTCHRLDILEAIPPHSGLGSGTQLALAVAAGLRRLHGLPLDTRGDAERLGRGGRSGIGVALFEQGGVVVDGGKAGEGPPPLIAHLPLPQDWRILLLLDHKRQGVHGADEIAAFENLPPFPREQAARICHLVLLRALPALAEHDLDAFGAAITEIQSAVGDHFAAAQGGRFTSKNVAASMALLRDWGVAGIGQSSWGPTGFAFMRSEAEAQRLTARLAATEPARALELVTVRASTGGALIEETVLNERRTG